MTNELTGDFESRNRLCMIVNRTTGLRALKTIVMAILEEKARVSLVHVTSRAPRWSESRGHKIVESKRADEGAA